MWLDAMSGSTVCSSVTEAIARTLPQRVRRDLARRPRSQSRCARSPADASPSGAVSIDRVVAGSFADGTRRVLCARGQGATRRTRRDDNEPRRSPLRFALRFALRLRRGRCVSQLALRRRANGGSFTSLSRVRYPTVRDGCAGPHAARARCGARDGGAFATSNRSCDGDDARLRDVDARGRDDSRHVGVSTQVGVAWVLQV